MISQNNIIDVFNILHDGTIGNSVMDGDLWYFEVFIPYLANRVEKDFTTFKVSILDAKDLRFEGWLKELIKGTAEVIGFNSIFQEELEILSAEEKERIVAVSCNIASPESKFCGGKLHFRCGSARVFDESGKEYTIDQLEKLCKAYWDEWSQRAPKVQPVASDQRR